MLTPADNQGFVILQLQLPQTQIFTFEKLALVNQIDILDRRIQVVSDETSQIRQSQLLVKLD